MTNTIEPPNELKVVAKLKLLWDVKVLLTFSCTIPLFEVVHSLMYECTPQTILCLPNFLHSIFLLEALKPIIWIMNLSTRIDHLTFET